MLKKISYFLLLVYIFTIPVMRVPVLPLLGQKVQYSEAVFIILFIIFLLLLAGKQIGLIKKRFLLIHYSVLAAASAWILVTALRSPDKIGSFIDFCGIFYLFSAYMLITQLIGSDEKLFWRVIYCWCFVVFGVSIIGFIEYFYSRAAISSNIMNSNYYVLNNVSPFLTCRMQSTFRLANMLATYLHAGLIIMSVALIKKENNVVIKRMLISGIFIILAAAFLTKSRIFAGILFSSFLMIMKYRGKISFFLKFSFFSALIIAVLLAFSSIIWYVFPIKVDYGKRFPGISLNLEYFPYYFYNQAAIGMLRDHPFLGVGVGMYNRNLTRYINLTELEHSFHIFSPDYRIGDDPHSLQVKKYGMDPHSTYLGWAAETGLIGVSLIITFLSMLLSGLFFLYKNARGQDKLIAWIFICGIAGFLVNGIYMDILTLRHFWLLLAMASCFIIISRDKDKIRCAV